MRQNKSNPTSWTGFKEGANGLKHLSMAGHYDFGWLGTSSTYQDALWGNPIYNFQRGAANPTGGQSTFMFLRGDKNHNDTISYDTNPNAAANEYFHYSALDGVPTYGFLGQNTRYSHPQKIGLDTNPALTSTPNFDFSSQQMQAMQLSGVSVSFLGAGPNGSIEVEVRFNDTDLAHSTRWTGNLRVNDVPGAANGYDVNILAGVSLRLDRSGTPNRTLRGGRLNDLINDTYLSVANGATVHLEANALLDVGIGTTVFVAEGGQLLADAGSVVRVRNQGRVSVQSQAEADALRQYGQLDLQPGGQLEIRDTGLVLTGRPGPGLTVYPNPAQRQQLRFELTGVPAAEAATYTYRLLTPYGRAVQQGYCTPAPLSLAGLPAGSYLLEISSPAGQRSTRRVQINP